MEVQRGTLQLHVLLNSGRNTPLEKTAALELRGITKTFGDVVANHDISLTVYKGEILSILGENGSGKTTLMNMIAGIYYPDSGQIFVDGKEASIHSPREAFDYRIGMIHQHFKLVNVLSAAENIILGLNEPGRYNLEKASEKMKRCIFQLYTIIWK
ncbi:MAG: ATP-binding cassette domain-containing protein [Eubacteriaceae bacterium]|nr:ATP-binding cassette domain-containing protein [Eubacteriaceae bacterium]